MLSIIHKLKHTYPGWWLSGTLIFRTLMLFGAAFAGYFAWKCGYPIVKPHFNGNNGGVILQYIEPLSASILVVLTLWGFRTYDARQQIAKSQAQIYQGHYVTGMDKIAKTDSFNISIGVQILTEVSQSTREFDKNIRLAFIKRLQHLPDNLCYPNGESVPLDVPLNISLPTLNHIPHIFDWLLAHAERNGINVNEESIDVPEMYFSIGELESTNDFQDDLKALNKKISLLEIKQAMEEYNGVRAFTDLL